MVISNFLSQVANLVAAPLLRVLPITELPRLGWKPTTENLIENENGAFQIYRNAEQALAQLKVETRGGKTQATVEYQSPTVFEENEQRFQELRKKQEAEKAAKP